MTSRPLILLHVALNSPRRTATNRGASDKRTATTATQSQTLSQLLTKKEPRYFEKI